MVYDLKNVGFQVGQKWLLKDLNFSIPSNALTVVIGPNGSGKSTLLRILSGDLKPSCGTINFLSAPLAQKSCGELAKQRSMLSQGSTSALPFKSYEIVAMGLQEQNYSFFGDNRYEKTLPFMKMVTVEQLAVRDYATLSGGEAKRVDIARMLAQETKIYLVDEPTNHLDPYYQYYVLNKCKSLVQEGNTVIAVLHDLNLAMQYADEIIVLKEGNLIAKGITSEVITKDLIKHVYDMECELIQHAGKWVCLF